MPDRPSWCRALTQEECDFPAGCSACAADRKKLTVDDIVRSIKALDRASRPYAEMLLLGSSELLGHVRKAEIRDGVLHIEAELTADGQAFVRELEAQGSIPIWHRPTPVGLLGPGPRLVDGLPDESPSVPAPPVDAVARPAPRRARPRLRAANKTRAPHRTRD